MFMAIQRELQRERMSVADLFPVSGVDHRGTLEARHLPTGAVLKTGTLNDVSALAGAIPTRDRGLVWFVIINRGWNIQRLRTSQDQLLQRLIAQWHLAPVVPAEIAPRYVDTPTRLGGASRNDILYRT